jgi:branched-chain amino acid aminotransferase
MTSWVWIDGVFYEKENAKISVFDHGLLYGDGVFEGLRAYEGKIFRVRQHVERLFDSAKAIMLKIPYTVAEIEGFLFASLEKNGVADGYLRLVVTRGTGDLGLDPRKCKRPTLFIIAEKLKLYPQEFYDNGLEVITGATPMPHHDARNPRIKSLNYFANIMAKIEGIQAGVEEVLMLTSDGHVAECSGDNVFAVFAPDLYSAGKTILKTPPPYAGILKGITRDAVIELALKAGYEVREEPMTRYDLWVASEMFLTGTAAKLIPVVKLDGREIGTGKPGPATQDLRERFHALTRA